MSVPGQCIRSDHHDGQGRRPHQSPGVPLRPSPLPEIQRGQVHQPMSGRNIGGYRTETVLIDPEPATEDQFDHGGEDHHDPDLPAHERGLGERQPDQQSCRHDAEQPLLGRRGTGVHQ